MAILFPQSVVENIEKKGAICNLILPFVEIHSFLQ